DPDARMVSEVGLKLVKSTEAFNSPYRDNFNYYLLNDSKTVNAFALPGGQIFITRALYDRLENEAELAGVLGHETGHVIGRHTSEQLAKSQLGQSLVTAVAVGSSDRRGGGYSSTIIAGTVNHMLSLHYSRDDETEADTF